MSTDQIVGTPGSGLLTVGLVILVFGITGYILTDAFIKEHQLPIAIGQFGCQSDVGGIARLLSADLDQECQNLGMLVGLVGASLIICPILMIIGPIMAILGWLEIAKSRKAKARENTSNIPASGNKQFLIQQFKWIGISLALSLGISFIVPFPLSLPIIIGVFILLSFYMRKRAIRMGMSGASPFGANSNSLNYYCMSCGTKHDQAACPKCGSKSVKVGP